MTDAERDAKLKRIHAERLIDSILEASAAKRIVDDPRYDAMTREGQRIRYERSRDRAVTLLAEGESSL